MSNVANFTTTLVVDVLYDVTPEGWRSTPRVAKPILKVGGVQLHVSINYFQSERHPYALFYSIDEATVATFADGWRIVAEYTSSWKSFDGTTGQDENVVHRMINSQCRCALLSNFGVGMDQFVYSMNSRFESVHPYRLPFLNEEQAMARHGDCMILVKGEESTPIFVNKTVLAIGSSYFNNLFFGVDKPVEKRTLTLRPGSKKKSKKEGKEGGETIELGDTTTSNFLEYLYRVYSPNRPFTFERMGVILGLAIRFENEDLIQEAENFLLRCELTNSEMKKKLLQWGDLHRRQQLIEHAANLMNRDELREFTTERPGQMNMESMSYLMSRFMSLS